MSNKECTGCDFLYDKKVKEYENSYHIKFYCLRNDTPQSMLFNIIVNTEELKIKVPRPKWCPLDKVRSTY